jgi:hypothetical protein
LVIDWSSPVDVNSGDTYPTTPAARSTSQEIPIARRRFDTKKPLTNDDAVDSPF